MLWRIKDDYINPRIANRVTHAGRTPMRGQMTLYNTYHMKPESHIINIG